MRRQVRERVLVTVDAIHVIACLFQAIRIRKRKYKYFIFKENDKQTLWLSTSWVIVVHIGSSIRDNEKCNGSKASLSPSQRRNVSRAHWESQKYFPFSQEGV